MRLSYQKLEEMFQEEQKQKHEIRKQKRKEPEMESLTNENEYLKLNVMELESEIERFVEQNFKKEVEIKTLKEEKESLFGKLESMERLSH